MTITVKDAAGSDVDLKTTLDGTDEVPHHIVDSSALPSGAATSANQTTMIGHLDGVEGLLTTIDADTGGMLTALQALDNAVAGNEFQVDVITMPTVTVSTHAVTQSGTWAMTGAAAEDAAVSGNPVLVGGRYDSSARTLETGDVGAIALNASGQVLVEIAAGAGSGGTAAADDGDFTAASTSGTPIMGVYQSTPTAVTDGDMGIVLINEDRQLVVAPSSAQVTAGATQAIQTILVDTAGDPVSVGGGTQYTEDAAAASDPVGTALMLVRRDTPSASEVTANGDNVAAKASSTGAMYVELLGGTTKLGSSTDGLLVNLGANNDVTVTGTVTVGSHAVTNAGTFATQVDGAALTALQLIDNNQVAHGSASAAIGVGMIGLQARSTDVTAEASGDAVWAQATLVGKQVVQPYSISQVQWQYTSPTAVTDTADDAAKTAAGSGVRNYITGIQVVCNHATTGTVVVVKSASTVIWTGYCAPLGGGMVVPFNTPLKGGDNEAINVANITNSSSTYFSLQGYTSVES